MILLSAYNAPFLFALAFIISLGVLEILSLLIGASAFSHIDSSIGTHLDLATGDNLLVQALSWLHIGKLPLLVTLVLLLGSFAIIGISGQYLMISLLQTPLSAGLMALISFVLSLPTLHFIGRWLTPYLPKDESFAVSEDSFIGSMALVTQSAGQPGMSAECKIIDAYGQPHYFLIEPENSDVIFTRGERVLIIAKISAARFLASKNPWPNLL
uniref:OB-fold-containig protein n=1 Tax=Hafnia alvei TaxID=569 RepID=UPI00243267A7|nr:OB-fold-containig protein [Hafnia alvei]